MWLASVPHLLFLGAGKTEKMNRGGKKKKIKGYRKKIQGTINVMQSQGDFNL